MSISLSDKLVSVLQAGGASHELVELAHTQFGTRQWGLLEVCDALHRNLTHDEARRNSISYEEDGTIPDLRVLAWFLARNRSFTRLRFVMLVRCLGMH